MMAIRFFGGLIMYGKDALKWDNERPPEFDAEDSR